jgi:hypothetical protein
MGSLMARTVRWKRAATATLIVATLGIPIGAEAQERVGVAVGAGGVFGTDPPPAENFSAPLFMGSIQRVMKGYFVLEGELTYWAHTSRFDYGPHDVSGPSGVIGRVGRTTVLDDRKYWTLGLNFLVRSKGALRVFGGAGAGLVMEDTEYSQTETGCSVPSQPRSCDPYAIARVRGPLPVFRALGGVEVPVATHLALIGTVRAEAIAWEGGSNMVTAIAGVRFYLR